MKRHIPNLFTLGNLFCGTIAAIFAISSTYEIAALFVAFGIILDFFDGFLARILKVQGELGKQLDSLADMVTSGVVPGIVMYNLIEKNFINASELIDYNNKIYSFTIADTGYLKLLGLLLTLSACYRLAKFNIDTRQSESFIGLPTPAMSLFVVSLPLIYSNTEFELMRELIENDYFLVTVTLVLSYLMNSNIPLFSLKFKNFDFRTNVFKYLLMVISVILLVTIHYLAIPTIIIIYIILSVIQNMTVQKDSE